jgi:hypothetical protein
MPPEVRRAREQDGVKPRGYSAGQGDAPPMGAIVGIGIVAIAGALLLGKLGAS